MSGGGRPLRLRKWPNNTVRPNMRCIVHWSRLYLLAQLIGALGFGAVLFAYRSEVPAIVLGGLGIVWCPLTIALLWIAIARKPTLTIDERGITYHRGRLSRIDWSDILSAEQLPRVQRWPNGDTNSCLREAWRPIRLSVRGRKPDKGTITIHLFGMDADSAKIYECIQSHLPKPLSRQ